MDRDVKGARKIDGTGPKAQSDSTALQRCLEGMLDAYFSELNGHSTCNLYNLVLREVEEPLLRRVLEYSNGNRSRAAKMLGIHRATLRHKLEQYGIT